MEFEIIICEDDPLQNEALVRRIKDRFPRLAVYGYTEPQTLIGHIRNVHARRIILMDIVLGNGADGIETARTIKMIDPGCAIIFLSSFLEKACDVYEVDHCYFVYKPQQEQRLEPAIRKALDLLSRRPAQLVVHTGSSTLFVPADDILYLERIKRYTLIHCSSRTIKVKEDLDELLGQLPSTFMRCHRSFVVSFGHVRAYKVHDVEMDDGQLISVSRSYVQKFREAFQRYVVQEGSVS